MFLLSITPKRFLHDSFASHIDDYRLKKGGPASLKNTTISSAGFNCKIDDLVVEGFFVQSSVAFSLYKPLFYREYSVEKYSSYLPDNHFVSRLRGPPNECA